MNKLYSEGLILLILHIHMHIYTSDIRERERERESGGVEFSQSLAESKHAAQTKAL